MTPMCCGPVLHAKGSQPLLHYLQRFLDWQKQGHKANGAANTFFISKQQQSIACWYHIDNPTSQLALSPLPIT